MRKKEQKRWRDGKIDFTVEINIKRRYILELLESCPPYAFTILMAEI